MKRGVIIGAAIVVLLLLVGAIVGISVVGIYNSLVNKSTAVDQQWANVEVQLQRRYDLIPSLVAATRGYLRQEQTIFRFITEARAKYAGASSVAERVRAANELEAALGRLLVIVEDNPEIKSDAVVMGLMDEVAGTENRISVERRRYNEMVMEYNAFIKRFPTNLVASAFGFGPKLFFEAVSGSEVAPKVDLETGL